MTTPDKTQNDTTPAETSALFEASRAAHEPRMVHFDRGSADAGAVLLVPDRMGVVNVKQYLDQYRERPERAKGSSTHATLDSLTAHTKRNMRQGSAAFLAVDGERATLTVIYDYHEQLAQAEQGARPHWCEHTATYSFPLSDAFKVWRQKSNTPLTQPDFAAHLEARTEELARPTDAGPLALQLAAALYDADGADDVTDEQARGVIASPGRLRAMAKKIALRVEERAEEERDGSGNVTILYRSTLTEGQTSAGQAKGDVAEKVARPQMFLVRLPVFQGGAAYVLPVRLATKVSSGRVMWTFALHRADLALEAAQNDVAEAFAAATGVPVFRGAPEGPAK